MRAAARAPATTITNACKMQMTKGLTNDARPQKVHIILSRLASSFLPPSPERQREEERRGTFQSFQEFCEEDEAKVGTPLMNETKWRVGDVVVIWSEEISFSRNASADTNHPDLCPGMRWHGGHSTDGGEETLCNFTSHRHPPFCIHTSDRWGAAFGRGRSFASPRRACVCHCVTYVGRPRPQVNRNSTQNATRAT